MTDAQYTEEDMLRAFKTGWWASRKRGSLTSDMPRITATTAEGLFNQWREQNF